MLDDHRQEPTQLFQSPVDIRIKQRVIAFAATPHPPVTARAPPSRRCVASIAALTWQRGEISQPRPGSDSSTPPYSWVRNMFAVPPQQFRYGTLPSSLQIASDNGGKFSTCILRVSAAAMTSYREQKKGARVDQKLESRMSLVPVRAPASLTGPVAQGR